jgi:uncharacterized protein YciI
VTVKEIAEDQEGHVWFGTTGGVTKYDGKFFTTYMGDDGLGSTDVWFLLVDHAGTLWVGTVEGVFIFDGSTFTSFELPEGTPDPNKGVTSSRIVWRIMEDGRSRLWFVGEGCVFTYDVDAVSRVPVMDEESVTYVSSILEDQTGNLWFASSKGLLRSEGGAFVNVTERAGLSGGVGGMCEDRHGNIWFAVQGSGVYRYDGVSLTHFSEKGRSGRWPGRDLVRRLDGGVPIRRRVVRQRDPRRPVVGSPGGATLFVILLTYQKPLAELYRLMPEHVQFLEEGFRAGVFLACGRQVPRTGGVILAVGTNRAAIDSLMTQDPFVREAAATCEVIEFRTSLHHPALASFADPRTRSVADVPSASRLPEPDSRARRFEVHPATSAQESRYDKS